MSSETPAGDALRQGPPAAASGPGGQDARGAARDQVPGARGAVLDAPAAGAAGQQQADDAVGSGQDAAQAGAGGGQAPAADAPAGEAPAADDAPAGDAPAGDSGPGLQAGLEAIMLVADEPVAEVLLAQVLERPREEVAVTLRQLAAGYAASGRGFELREVAGGWRLYTRPDCAPLVERFVRDGQEVRLTQAALETLAVVAYRQPVSRARVSAVRGVNCDGVMRTLLLRGLVEESGTDSETGAILYRTTGYFLERLGVASLDDLPDLAPFLPEDFADIEELGA